MIDFKTTQLPGVFLISTESFVDERGSFDNLYDMDAFAKNGIKFEVKRYSIAHNTKRLTLRGLHYSVAPSTESKLVRCTSGYIWDVVADVNPASETYTKWIMVTLSGKDAIYIPQGYAHGYITGSDDVKVEYLLSDSYRPDLQRGIRWDDITLNIPWPIPKVISKRDQEFPALSQGYTEHTRFDG